MSGGYRDDVTLVCSRVTNTREARALIDTMIAGCLCLSTQTDLGERYETYVQR